MTSGYASATSSPTARAMRLEAAKEALRAEQADEEVGAEHEGVLEGGREVHHGDALDHAHQQRGAERAEDAPEPAERHDRVGEHGEGQADLGIHGEEVCEDDASDADE